MGRFWGTGTSQSNVYIQKLSRAIGPPPRTESILNDFTENIANIKHLIEDSKTQPDQSSSQWMLLSRIDIQSKLLMLLSLLDILASRQLRPDSCIW